MRNALESRECQNFGSNQSENCLNSVEQSEAFDSRSGYVPRFTLVHFRTRAAHLSKSSTTNTRRVLFKWQEYACTEPTSNCGVSLRHWIVQGMVRVRLKLIELWSQRMKIIDSAIHELTSPSSTSFPVDLIVSNSRSSTVQVSTGTVMRKRQIEIFACA